MIRQLPIGVLLIAAPVIVAGNAFAADDNPIVGKGVVCDTAAQAERFFRAEVEEDMTVALKLVNDPSTVCAIGPVVYLRREKAADVAEKTIKAEVTKVTVIGAYDPRRDAWVRMVPTDQYTLFYPEDLGPSI